MSDIAVKKAAPPQMARRERDPFRMMSEWLRWDPFREMEPLFAAELPAFAPAFEVKETGDAFVFKADVPGIKESDIEVKLTGNRLTIAGKREAEKEDKNETFYTYERSYGSFSRTFTLPDKADGEHVKAEMKNGELSIVVPKLPAAVAKRIPVAAGDKPKA